MKTHGLENYIRKQIHELERHGVFDIATDSIRAWIDIFNEEEKEPSEGNQELQGIISEWHESEFQKPLIEIIRERLNEVK